MESVCTLLLAKWNTSQVSFGRRAKYCAGPGRGTGERDWSWDATVTAAYGYGGQDEQESGMV